MTLNIPQGNLSSKLAETLLAQRKQNKSENRAIIHDFTEQAVCDWQKEHAAELLAFSASDLAIMITRAVLSVEYVMNLPEHQQ